MSTIRVRRLDANWDPTYGDGQNDYIFDLDAVVQIVRSRLGLWLAEWWENLDEGLPMFQKILGKQAKNKIVIDREIQKRIAETNYVTSIDDFESEYDSSIREYSCSVSITTAFGSTSLVLSGG